MHRAVTGYEFPRVYRPAGLWRYLLLALGVIAIAAGAVGSWYFATGHEAHGSGQTLLVVICAAFLALGMALAGYVQRSAVTLWQDRIELAGLGGKRTMLREEILGRRSVESQNGPPVLVLVPKREGQPKLSIPSMFRFDAAFEDWVGALPDLDAQDAEQFQQQMQGNAELGANAEERTQSLRNIRWLCRGLMIATFGLCLWTWVYPSPYRWLVSAMAALPWVAIYIAGRYRGVVVINEKRRDPRPGVGIPFIMPGLVLALRVIFDMTPLGWKEPLVLAIVVSAVLTFAAWKVDVATQQKPAMVILLFLLSLGYGYGTAMEANGLFDRSRVTVYPTQVTGKYISSGRSRSYYLKIAPWGPKTGGDRVQVSRRMYDSETVGATVCVGLRNGALGIPWYFVRECR